MDRVPGQWCSLVTKQHLTNVLQNSNFYIWVLWWSSILHSSQWFHQLSPLSSTLAYTMLLWAIQSTSCIQVFINLQQETAKETPQQQFEPITTWVRAVITSWESLTKCLTITFKTNSSNDLPWLSTDFINNMNIKNLDDIQPSHCSMLCEWLLLPLKTQTHK